MLPVYLLFKALTLTARILFLEHEFNVRRTLYALNSILGPAHRRLVAGTVDMVQKWPEVVSL